MLSYEESLRKSQAQMAELCDGIIFRANKIEEYRKDVVSLTGRVEAMKNRMDVWAFELAAMKQRASGLEKNILNFQRLAEKQKKLHSLNRVKNEIAEIERAL